MGLSKKPQICLWCKCEYRKDERQSYCSRECYSKAKADTKITVPCDFCGKEKTRPPSEVNQNKGNFCNMHCLHNKKYFEKTGYVMNDELRNQIADLMVEGWSYSQLVDCYGLSKSTVVRIKKEYFDIPFN